MDDFVIFDFVELRGQLVLQRCKQYKRVYPVFQRLYPLWAESTGGEAEVGELNVPCSVNEEVLRGR